MKPDYSSDKSNNPLRIKLGAILRSIGDIWPHFFHVRFPLLTVLMGSLMVLLVAQIRETFFLLDWFNNPERFEQTVFAYMATFLLAMAVWYSARTVYRIQFHQWPSSAPDRLPRFKKIAPRLMGTMVPLLMALGCILAANDIVAEDDELGQTSVRLALAFVAEAVIVLFIVVYRRPASSLLANALPSLRNLELPAFEQDRQTGLRSGWSDLSHVTKAVFLGTIALNLCFTLIANHYPHELAGALGPIATIMLAGAFLTITGTVLTFIGSKTQIPVLSLLLIFAVVLHTGHFNDNHYVRQCPLMNSNDDPSMCDGQSLATKVLYPAADDQVNASLELSSMELMQDSPLEQHWAQWHSRLNPTDPIFLVSAEGGGIRAAAWTAMVLTSLSDATNGKFTQHLFAASGVSGGSLGIATYLALEKAKADFETPTETSETDTDPLQLLQVHAAGILSQDFLTPTLVNQFFVDTLQRFLPGRLFIDRGQRLEESWVVSWEQHFSHLSDFPNPLNRRFDSLYEDTGGDSQLPLAFFNATVVQSGDRFIQTPFRLMNPQQFSRLFPGAKDSHDYLRPSIGLNAAAHNSARFTYISPAGTIPKRGELPAIQVVDGGYFENSGTVTLSELYGWIAEQNLSNPIYVIHISNDFLVPPMSEMGKDACSNEQRAALGGRLAGEAWAPIAALVRTRNARGENARKQLAGEVPKALNELIHYRLCDSEVQLPLGWVLSPRAVPEMQRQLGICGNDQASFIANHRGHHGKIRQLLGSTGTGQISIAPSAIGCPSNHDDQTSDSQPGRANTG